MSRIRRMAGASAVPVARTPWGTTEVTEWVLALVAARAAQATPGVVAVGILARRGGRYLARAAGPQAVKVAAQGVGIVWEAMAARAALPIVVDLGHAVDQVAEAVRRQVTVDLQRLAGIEVAVVDVEVLDVVFTGPWPGD